MIELATAIGDREAAVSPSGDDVGFAQRVMTRTIELASRLVAIVLATVRALTLLAAGLAVANAALFLVPRADETRFWFAAALVLAVLSVPAIVLQRVGSRVAALRDAVRTITETLPSVLSVPDDVAIEAREIADMVESTTSRRLPGRLAGRARVLVHVRRLLGAYADQHRDLFDASRTALTYGPRDVVYLTYGLLGVAVLILCVPVLALVAVLS